MSKRQVLVSGRGRRLAQWCLALLTGLLLGAVVEHGNVWASVTISTSPGGTKVVRLHNRDAQSYRLYVRHQASAVHTSIGPRTITNICSDECTIELKDSGTKVTAKPGDTVTIKGGKLVQ